MDKKFKLFGIIACAVIIGFTFAGCEGPMGPPGDSGDPFPPELVIDINVSHNEVRLLRGRSINLTASASPSNAAVETIVWEFYDIPSNELIDIRMPSPPPPYRSRILPRRTSDTAYACVR
ncbi:MAG: hypothetical protein FWC97_06160, partial [Treponema sp.]|nr:hypothetical protein [Treponema sp.]